MSEENIEALKRAFADAADQRPDAFFELLDEDVVWDVGDFPGGRFHGREGVREFFRQWVGAFEDWNFEVREMLDAGHSVFVHMHQRGRGKTSGAATEIDFWQVWLFLEGKVVRFVQKPDRRLPSKPPGCRSKAISGRTYGSCPAGRSWIGCGRVPTTRKESG